MAPKPHRSVFIFYYNLSVKNWFNKNFETAIDRTKCQAKLVKKAVLLSTVRQICKKNILRCRGWKRLKKLASKSSSRTKKLTWTRRVWKILPIRLNLKCSRYTLLGWARRRRNRTLFWQRCFTRITIAIRSWVTRLSQAPSNFSTVHLLTLMQNLLVKRNLRQW